MILQKTIRFYKSSIAPLPMNGMRRNDDAMKY